MAIQHPQRCDDLLQDTFRPVVNHLVPADDEDTSEGRCLNSAVEMTESETANYTKANVHTIFAPSPL